MTKIPSSSTEQFVDAVHRRLLMLRILEQAGLAIVLASALAVPLLAIAISQSLATLPILLFCGAFALLVAIALVIHRWPTRLQAAIEADRQLRFDDLLVTALNPAANADPDFTAMLHRIADRQCANHSPSEILLRRFGFRIWGGIALAVSLAVVLAVIPFAPTRSQAKDANASVLTTESAPETPDGSLLRSPAASVVNDPMSEPLERDLSSLSDITVKPNLQTAAEPLGGHDKTQDRHGTGGGSASSREKIAQDAQHAGSPGRTPKRATGDAAGGGAESSRAFSGAQSDRTAGGTTFAARGSSVSDQWMGGSNRNADTHRDSQEQTPASVPAEDRDLVRDFFRR
jgi:hypothetical protein